MSYTPMMQQYLQIKADYKDAFLFFRLGDFYEMFFDDAVRASQLLEITLTSRDAGSKERIPMCGVPHHSAQNYIETLVQKGFKVAVCEQTEDPKVAKGVVKREVVQLITPGTIMEGKDLDGKSNHFIGAAVKLNNNQFAFSYLDLSTGEAAAMWIEGEKKELFQQLHALNIRELVIEEAVYDDFQSLASSSSVVLSIENRVDSIAEYQLRYFADVPKELHKACQLLLCYIEHTQMRSLSHIQSFVFHETKHYLKIDANSKRNLELISSLRGDLKGTLLWLLDDTSTAMGGRKLKQWLHQPLASRGAIEQRLNIVTELLEDYFARAELKELLSKVYDLERLAGRVAFGNVGGRDLAQLRDSLYNIPAIKNVLLKSNGDQLPSLGRVIDACDDVLAYLSNAITDHPPISVKEGGVIREGFNEKLDEFRDASHNGKDWIAQLEQRERQETGIKNLKIGYNRVFGYYIEVTKSNINAVDLSRYERKQTLANAERYITEELKEKESIILHAEEESLVLEYQLFTEVREELKQFIPRLQALAASISELDVLISFAEVSDKYHFIKPVFHTERSMKITNGRHPVVEKMMNKQLYVPNDCVLSAEQNMMLITGPNMSGKSTYMRQVALIAVMAQIGCYVPADEAELPIIDQIFTRIGAADDLAGGQSTFMVEMLESQQAITNATSSSLLLFDEIGRGTSTYDGMALAQSMMEYIHDKIGANTLFSTHYHELTTLENELERLQNVHVSATEQDGKVVFLHKVKKGPADKSYGIHVAELAELPSAIIERARILLNQFEGADQNIEKNAKKSLAVHEETQLSLFEEEKPALPQTKAEPDYSPSENEIINTLKQLNVSGTTPMEALQLVYSLQQKLLKQ